MDEDLGLEIKKISEALAKKRNAQAKKYGLTSMQGRVLTYLFAHDGKKVTQRDLEDYLGVSHVTVSGVIYRMKLRGLIDSTVDPEDRRARNITIGRAKRKALDSLRDEHEQSETLLTVGFTDEERKKLAEYLGRMYANVTEMTKCDK